MQQQFRMRKNGHFQRVYKKGKPAAAREITLLAFTRAMPGYMSEAENARKTEAKIIRRERRGKL